MDFIQLYLSMVDPLLIVDNLFFVHISKLIGQARIIYAIISYKCMLTNNSEHKPHNY